MTPGISPVGGPGLSGPRGRLQLRSPRRTRSVSATVTGDLGTLVGANFLTPIERNVRVRLDLAGGTHDPTLPTVTVAADGTFTLEHVPTGRLLCLTIAWRTGAYGVPVQTIVRDRITLTDDTTLVELLS